MGASAVGNWAISSGSVETITARAYGQRLYWLSAAILCALVVWIPTVTGNTIFHGLIILVVAMPLIQLVGAGAAAIIIFAAPGQHKSASLAQVGRLTLGMLAGTVGGALLIGLGLGGLGLLFK